MQEEYHCLLGGCLVDFGGKVGDVVDSQVRLRTELDFTDEDY